MRSAVRRKGSRIESAEIAWMILATRVAMLVWK